MNSHKNFLEFNGKNIVFLNNDGVYWIALKPICEALNLDADSTIKRTKRDAFLGGCTANMTVQVLKNGILQGRKMTCLPEQYIYGWICFLSSDNKELMSYKKTCYDLLFDHFNGGVTGRKEILLERKLKDEEIVALKTEMKKSNDNFIKLRKLEQERKELTTQLNRIDSTIVNQTEMNFN